MPKSRKWLILVVCMFVLGGIACGEDPKQLFETAQFEEQQNNKAHARELYERILQMHPDSKWAKQANSRLAKLSVGKRQPEEKLNTE